jgi:hypothetical protein
MEAYEEGLAQGVDEQADEREKDRSSDEGDLDFLDLDLESEFDRMCYES